MGASCEFVREVAALSVSYNAVLKGKTVMSAKNTNTVTASNNKDAEEKKVTVPQQSEGETFVEEAKAESNSDTNEQPELTVIDGGKKTAKERVAALIEKAKENKKFFIGMAVGALTTTIAIALSAKEKEQTEELVYDDELNPPVDPVTGKVIENDSDKSAV